MSVFDVIDHVGNYPALPPNTNILQSTDGHTMSRKMRCSAMK